MIHCVVGYTEMIHVQVVERLSDKVNESLLASIRHGLICVVQFLPLLKESFNPSLLLLLTGTLILLLVPFNRGTVVCSVLVLSATLSYVRERGECWLVRVVVQHKLETCVLVMVSVVAVAGDSMADDHKDSRFCW